MAEPIHYTSFPGFDGTSLEDSFVLEIQATPGRLNITLDLMIGWAHPSYRDPLEGVNRPGFDGDIEDPEGSPSWLPPGNTPTNCVSV
ncbi:hypothetical protein ACFU8W_10070, partial [Streptomyces sp. NPDC057565]|uniref:hypothetical protein n=1 Tax=Streptomyces sp. NPDC057565 TaxID=3346169 RepID=UPI0036B57DB0